MINNPHYVSTPNEFLLPHKASSPISKIQYTHDPDKKWLAISSWDSTVRVFDLTSPNTPIELRSYKHDRAVLACSFAGNNKLVSGGLDRTVKSVDVTSGAESKVGNHSDTIRCLEYSVESDLVVSGSWDSSVKFWDLRTSQSVGIADVGDKVYAMDVKKNRAVIGTKDRKVHVYDIRNLRQPEQVRDSPLKYQTRAIRCFPTGEAFVLSSIEGRVAVEYLDPNPDVQKDKYAFKCHRNKDEASGIEQIYPVNALTFHPIHRTFASGGSDALVNIWDPFNRKRLYQFHRFPTSIVSLSFSADGSQLAIGSSYLYELDATPNPIPENTVTVRRIIETETKVR
uniref:WD_REPEATS_REGION domain-containing protein n=1 Tax=Steinernema glaseri TaxID=37863 RepID=A0A1I8ABL9_9BILA